MQVMEKDLKYTDDESVTFIVSPVDDYDISIMAHEWRRVWRVVRKGDERILRAWIGEWCDDDGCHLILQNNAFKTRHPEKLYIERLSQREIDGIFAFVKSKLSTERDIKKPTEFTVEIG